MINRDVFYNNRRFGKPPICKSLVYEGLCSRFLARDWNRRVREIKKELSLVSTSKWNEEMSDCVVPDRYGCYCPQLRTKWFALQPSHTRPLTHTTLSLFCDVTVVSFATRHSSLRHAEVECQHVKFYVKAYRSIVTHSYCRIWQF